MGTWKCFAKSIFFLPFLFLCGKSNSSSSSSFNQPCVHYWQPNTLGQILCYTYYQSRISDCLFRIFLRMLYRDLNFNKQIKLICPFPNVSAQIYSFYNFYFKIALLCTLVIPNQFSKLILSISSLFFFFFFSLFRHDLAKGFRLALNSLSSPVRPWNCDNPSA